MLQAVRSESDSLGRVDVPCRALWGAQTERARHNFRISGITVGRFPWLIAALAMTKQAAAQANLKVGVLESEKARAISAACAEITAGRHRDAFPLDYLQGGAGTSLNMNANEVIANLANEMLGGHRGIYDPVRPNDDVNASQSTNDVYPTAIRVSVLLAHVQLDAAIERLAAAFADRAAEFETVLKLGRTQLQDAVPMTLGQEFMAFANALRRDRCRLRDAVQLLSVVNLGGTAIGTGLNAPAGYSKSAIAELSAICGHALSRADDLIEASWDVSAFVVFSGALKALATKLSKIANDLRLLSSGPRGGLGEIILPQTQPGSSIMPGKVNPVIPEVVNQVAFQVIGNDLAITLAAEAGQLQLNAMEPLIAGNLHVSIQIMTGAITALAENCVSGISADAARCRANLDASVAVATALVPEVGYARSVEIANDALRLGRRIVDLTVERGILSRERAGDLLDPGNLVRPQGRAEQGNIA